MNNQKWWQDNDRYIPDPWTEITRLQKELEQLSITEAALRESLTGLSRESNEYRHKIETENDTLRNEIKSVVDSLNTAASIGGFDGYDEDTPLLVNITSHWNRLCLIIDKEVEKVQKENAQLKEALKEIATTAHCIALAGPLNTPTLQDAWGKFMKIDSMASNALAKKS
jgi:hypothetical protein